MTFPFILFVIVHIVFIVIEFLLGNVWDEKIILTACGFAICFYSIRKKCLTKLDSFADQSKKQSECLPWQCAGFILFCYFITNQRLESIHLFMYLMFGLYVILLMIHYFIADLNLIMDENQKNEVFPVRQMITVNNIIILALVVVGIIVIGAFFNGPYGSINHIIWKGFITFLTFLLALLNLSKSGDTITYTGPLEKQITETNIDDLKMETTTQHMLEASNDEHLFSYITFFLITVFVIVVICLLIYFITRMCKNLKIAKNNEYDEYETFYGNNKEVKPVFYERADCNENSNSDQNQQVRKIYKNNVKSGIKSIDKVSESNKNAVPNQNDMPVQLTKYIIKESQDNKSSDQITEIYEKARYSNQNLSSDDVKKIQDAIKKSKEDK